MKSADGEDLCHHIYRENNTYADALANKARQSGDVLFLSDRFTAGLCNRIYAQVDGSSSDGTGGADVILFVSSNDHVLTADDPHAEVVAFAGIQFHASNAMQTESVAFLLAFFMLAISSIDTRRIECIREFLSVRIDNRDYKQLSEGMLDFLSSVL